MHVFEIKRKTVQSPIQRPGVYGCVYVAALLIK